MLLRDVTENDSKLLFEWANDSGVRNNAIHKEKIEWEGHKKWFANKILDPATHIYILEANTQDIGQIRFDKVKNYYEIDYSISKDHRGYGYGSKIVEKGIQELAKVTHEENVFRAKVKTQNAASIKVFKKCGFNLIGKEEHSGEDYWVFQLNKNLETIVLLSEKSWNNKLVKHLQSQFQDYNWLAISNKKDFTLENLELISPKIIFIPHWSYIIPENIFSNYTCVVFHMTDLPYGRGGSPLQNLIVREHEVTKISALKVVQELDAGPIYLKEAKSFRNR